MDGPKLANMLQNGKTPLLPPKQLQEIGYTIVAYPLALLRCENDLWAITAAAAAAAAAVCLCMMARPTDSKHP